MNLDDASRVHVEWKIKLSRYLSNPDGSLKAAEVAQEDRCELGKWILGEGMKHSQIEIFRKLREEHARFHRAASEVVDKADQGKFLREEIALGSQSEFSLASNAVVSAIMGLQASIAGAP